MHEQEQVTLWEKELQAQVSSRCRFPSQAIILAMVASSSKARSLTVAYRPLINIALLAATTSHWTQSPAVCNWVQLSPLVSLALCLSSIPFFCLPCLGRWTGTMCQVMKVSRTRTISHGCRTTVSLFVFLAISLFVFLSVQFLSFFNFVLHCILKIVIL